MLPNKFARRMGHSTAVSKALVRRDGGEAPETASTEPFCMMKLVTSDLFQFALSSFIRSVVFSFEPTEQVKSFSKGTLFEFF